MRKAFIFVMCMIVLSSCEEKAKDSKNDYSAAEKAFKEGYVYVDGTYKIVHWDKSCKRTYKNVLLLKDFRELRNEVEFCNCVPIEKMKEIKNEMGLTKRY